MNGHDNDRSRRLRTRPIVLPSSEAELNYDIVMNSMNNLKQRLATRLEVRVMELENEIKQLESIRCGREEYKENVRKVKILKLRKAGAEKAITKYKADLSLD